MNIATRDGLELSVCRSISAMLRRQRRLGGLSNNTAARTAVLIR